METTTEKQPSLVSIGLKYGLLLGLVSIVYAMFSFITESFGNFFVNLFISLVLAILGVVLAMREFKKKNGGYMSYGQGVGLGLIVMIISSILSGLFTLLYIEYVDTNLTEKMVDATITQMSAFGVDADMMDEQRDKLLAEQTPVKQLTGALSNGIFGGLILSLIIAAFMKNARPEFD